jgi:hypothetical protein
MWLPSRALISSALMFSVSPSLRDFALEDRAHVQLATNRLRIRFFSLEAKGRVS